MRILILACLLALAGCATAPTRADNVCSVFSQKGGWINNWYREAKSVEREYGVPVPILMATIYKESTFRARARPPRRKILGFIPGKRISTAYGYAQALDGTWDEYRRKTGRYGARRSDFGDAVRFIGWYHSESHRKNGIPLNDAYSLYLAYYAGHGGYARGVWKSNAGMKNSAAKMAAVAQRYASQMASCGYR